VSERDEPGDTVNVFRTAAPYPVEWCVVCPTCGQMQSCTMSEDDFGVFRCSDPDGSPFVGCECGTIIEPLPVSMSQRRKT
jgi:hypothetical protein